MKTADGQERQPYLLSAPTDSGKGLFICGNRVGLLCWPFPVKDCTSYSSDSRKHCLLSIGV